MSAPNSPTRLSRDNHYVPVAYLKRWASPDQKVFVYRTLVSHASVPEWRRHSLKGIAYLQHLYCQVGHEAESDAVERWLAEAIDAPSEGVLSKVAAEERLTPADWDVLLRLFVASQARTLAYFFRRRGAWASELPVLMERVLQENAKALEAGVVMTAQQPQEPIGRNMELPARVRLRRNPDGQGAIIEAETLGGRKLWFFEIERMVTHTWRALRRFHWTILRAPGGTEWLTSDDPAVVAHVSRDQKVTWNGGWAVPGTVLLLSLSPDHVLYGRPIGSVPIKYSVASGPEAQFIQNCVVRHAFRMVFAREKDCWVPSVKPRRVDAAAFDHERNEFARYHEVQSKAEEDLEDDSTWHSPDSIHPTELRAREP